MFLVFWGGKKAKIREILLVSPVNTSPQTSAGMKWKREPGNRFSGSYEGRASGFYPTQELHIKRCNLLSPAVTSCKNFKIKDKSAQRQIMCFICKGNKVSSRSLYSQKQRSAEAAKGRSRPHATSFPPPLNASRQLWKRQLGSVPLLFDTEGVERSQSEIFWNKQNKKDFLFAPPPKQRTKTCCFFTLKAALLNIACLLPYIWTDKLQRDGPVPLQSFWTGLAWTGNGGPGQAASMAPSVSPPATFNVLEGGGGTEAEPLLVSAAFRLCFFVAAAAVFSLAAAPVRCCGGRLGETLVQRFASFSFLVQAALAALHHVNKVGQRLLLVHGNVPEVTTHRLAKKAVTGKVSFNKSTSQSLILKSEHL